MLELVTKAGYTNGNIVNMDLGSAKGILAAS